MVGCIFGTSTVVGSRAGKKEKWGTLVGVDEVREPLTCSSNRAGAMRKKEKHLTEVVQARRKTGQHCGPWLVMGGPLTHPRSRACEEEKVKSTHSGSGTGEEGEWVTLWWVMVVGGPSTSHQQYGWQGGKRKTNSWQKAVAQARNRRENG